MISTQKLLLIGIFMNLLIGLIGTSQSNMEKIDELAHEYEGTGATITEADTPPRTSESSTLSKNMVGNEKTTGISIWEVLGKAANPFSTMSSDDYEQYSLLWLLSMVLSWFRMAILIIMGYELWQIFFAKKQT